MSTDQIVTYVSFKYVQQRDILCCQATNDDPSYSFILLAEDFGSHDFLPDITWDDSRVITIFHMKSYV